MRYILSLSLLMILAACNGVVRLPAIDAGPVDAAPPDAGPPDAAPPDAAMPNAIPPEAACDHVVVLTGSATSNRIEIPGGYIDPSPRLANISAVGLGVAGGLHENYIDSTETITIIWATRVYDMVYSVTSQVALNTEHHWAREAADGAVSAGYEVGMGDFHRGSGLVQLMLSGDGVAVSELRYSTCP